MDLQKTPRIVLPSLPSPRRIHCTKSEAQGLSRAPLATNTQRHWANDIVHRDRLLNNVSIEIKKFEKHIINKGKQLEKEQRVLVG